MGKWPFCPNLSKPRYQIFTAIVLQCCRQKPKPSLEDKLLGVGLSDPSFPPKSNLLENTNPCGQVVHDLISQQLHFRFWRVSYVRFLAFHIDFCHVSRFFPRFLEQFLNPKTCGLKVAWTILNQQSINCQRTWWQSTRALNLRHDKVSLFKPPILT